MRAARETMPATGKKNPPFSPADVAMRFAVLAADSMTEPSMIMLVAIGEVRPDMADKLCFRGWRWGGWVSWGGYDALGGQSVGEGEFEYRTSIAGAFPNAPDDAPGKG